LPNLRIGRRNVPSRGAYSISNRGRRQDTRGNRQYKETKAAREAIETQLSKWNQKKWTCGWYGPLPNLRIGRRNVPSRGAYSISNRGRRQETRSNRQYKETKAAREAIETQLSKWNQNRVNLESAESQ
jgi:hypothetical protein